MTLIKLFAAVALPVCQLMAVAEPAHSQTPTLNLIAARDYIEGSFLGNEASFADAKYIFQASYQGNLFVLQNVQSKNFPLVTTIPVSSEPLHAITGDGTKIYITGADGNLYVYSEAAPFGLIKKVPYGVPLTSIAVDGAPKGSITIGEWGPEVAVDNSHIYLSQLNPGDVAVVDNKVTYAYEETFGNTFNPGVTSVFNRASGALLASLPNPTNNAGSASAVALFTDGVIMAQTTPGCCGAGVTLYDATTLKLLSTINEPYANTVATMNNDTLLVVGTEAGVVALYDIANCHAPVLLSSIDLRAVTGHTGSEDIEIRSLFIAPGGLIIASSSWGDSASQSPTLPSVFFLSVSSRGK